MNRSGSAPQTRQTPGRPCARAVREQLSAPQRLGFFAGALASFAFGGWLFLKDPNQIYLAALLLLFALPLFFVAIEVRPGQSYEISALWVCRGSDCRKLSALSEVGLDWSKQSLLSSWSLSLRMRLGSEAWLLPLTLAGWDEFWDCLRELRPDLGLPDWRYVKEIQRALSRPGSRGPITPPPGVEVQKHGWLVGILFPLVLVWLLDQARRWGLFAGGRISELVALLVMVYGADLLLPRIFPPRVLRAPWLDGEKPGSRSASG